MRHLHCPRQADVLSCRTVLMAIRYVVHQTHPQRRLIHKIVTMLRDGAVMAYPTDTAYAIAGALDTRGLTQRLEKIDSDDTAGVGTLVCRDLAELAGYARVDNQGFRLLKSLVPGPYAFILKAARGAPRRLQDVKRKTIKLRVPNAAIVQALLAELGQPLLSVTPFDPRHCLPCTDPEQLGDRYGRKLDIIIDGGAGSLTPTTVLDFAATKPRLVRAGLGPVADLLLDEEV